MAGLIVGAMVLGKKGVVDDECDQEARTCSQAGLDAKDAGATLATVSTITFVGGLVVAGVGVTVLLLASPDESGEVALTVAPTLGGAAIGLEGRF